MRAAMTHRQNVIERRGVRRTYSHQFLRRIDITMPTLPTVTLKNSRATNRLIHTTELLNPISNLLTRRAVLIPADRLARRGTPIRKRRIRLLTKSTDLYNRG